LQWPESVGLWNPGFVLSAVIGFRIGQEIAMKVSDVMTRRIVSVMPEATIGHAIRLMLDNHISGLPVIDDKDKLVGIVSEGDFLRRSETGTERKRSRWLDAFLGQSAPANDYVRSHGLKVKEVMTRKPITLQEDTPLDQVVHLMESHRVKRLPVVRGEKVVGIVSRANLMRALASIYRAAPKSSKGDAAIRSQILLEIAKQDWSVGVDVDVVVRDGIADIWGSIAELAQRDALKVLVERTPGVKQVEDHLTCELVSVS
jgi:CBS domain-containing protein